LYFNQLSPQPNAQFKLAVNTFIINSKANGNWDWDVFYIFRAQSQQNARINVANPGSFTITEVNSPTWTANQGYTFDGLTNYLNTNYNPNTHSSRYVLNSACLFVKIDTNTASGGQLDIGCGPTNNATSGAWMGARAFTDQRFFRLNEKSTFASGVSGSLNSIGNWHCIRTDVNSEKLFLNGSSVLSSTGLPTISLPVYDLYVGCVNNAGVATNFSDRRFSFAGAGSGTINATTFNTDLTTLGQISDTILSSSSPLTLANTSRVMYYTYTGSAPATWTLPINTFFDCVSDITSPTTLALEVKKLSDPPLDAV